MCLKKLSVLSLLLLLLSPLLFSEVILTDSEYQEITQALTESETALQNQEKSIATLQSELMNLKSELTQLQKLQTISQQIIEQQSENLRQHENYLKEQRRAQITTRILDHLRGFVGGYFVNEYQGNQ